MFKSFLVRTPSTWSGVQIGGEEEQGEPCQARATGIGLIATLEGVLSPGSLTIQRDKYAVHHLSGS